MECEAGGIPLSSQVLAGVQNWSSAEDRMVHALMEDAPEMSNMMESVHPPHACMKNVINRLLYLIIILDWWSLDPSVPSD